MPLLALLAVSLAIAAPAPAPAPANEVAYTIVRIYRPAKDARLQPGQQALLSSQQAVLRSGPLLRAAVARPEATDLPCLRNQPDPIAWLKRRLTLTTKSGPGTVRLSVSGCQPREAEALVGAVVDTYLGLRKEKQTRLRSLRTELELAEARCNADENQEEISATKREIAALHGQLEETKDVEVLERGVAK
jgi:hypothetical protein